MIYMNSIKHENWENSTVYYSKENPGIFCTVLNKSDGEGIGWFHIKNIKYLIK